MILTHPRFHRQQVYGMTETTGAVGGFGKDGASYEIGLMILPV